MRVGRAGAFVESHLAAHGRPQLCLEGRDVDLVDALRLQRVVAEAELGIAPDRLHAAALARPIPSPARLGSGRRTPRLGSGTPSNTIDSMRVWSWKYSRCSSDSHAQHACMETAGAQWADSGIPCARAIP